MKLSLVIPCFNEEGNVQKMYDETVKTFKNKVDDYEFVFIDDGSTDGTYRILKNLYEKETGSEIQVLSLSRNFGKEAAIFAGISSAKGDLICLIDADLQQRPEVVLQMLGVMKSDEDIDCVTAYQEVRHESKLMCSMKSLFYKIINKASKAEFKNGASDFRLMKRKMADAVIEMGEYHRFSKGIFGFVGFRTEYIPYTAKERHSGTTKWGARKLFSYALDGIISFTTFPLRLATFLGLLSAFLSVIYIIAVIVEKLAFGIAVPGYASIIVLLLFLGGLQLFSLGILGEYMSKVYIQVKQRPIYILKEHLERENNTNQKEKNL